MATPNPSTTPTTSTLTPATTTPPPISHSISIHASRPIPLTAAQEGQVRELYYARIRSYCAPEIRDFALCATGRTFTIPIKCRQQRLAMNDCMNAHASREEEDKAREEWFLQIPKRMEERVKEEAWKEEQRRKKREWWGLDEQGRRIEGKGVDDGRGR